MTKSRQFCRFYFLEATVYPPLPVRICVTFPPVPVVPVNTSNMWLSVMGIPLSLHPLASRSSARRSLSTQSESFLQKTVKSRVSPSRREMMVQHNHLRNLSEHFNPLNKTFLKLYGSFYILDVWEIEFNSMLKIKCRYECTRSFFYTGVCEDCCQQTFGLLTNK